MKCNYCDKELDINSDYVETAEFKDGANIKSIFHHKDCYESVMKGVNASRFRNTIDSTIDYVQRRVKGD